MEIRDCRGQAFKISKATIKVSPKLFSEEDQNGYECGVTGEAAAMGTMAVIKEIRNSERCTELECERKCFVAGK